MRRGDFAIGLLLAATAPTVRAEEPAKQHRIAIFIPAAPVAEISDAGFRIWRVFLEELRRLGNVEGQNLMIERYSGEGRPEGYPDLARQVVSRNPEVIVAETNPVALAVRAASGTTPVVWIGVEGIRAGLATSLAHPGGKITGVNLYDYEIWGKAPADPQGSRPFGIQGRVPAAAQRMAQRFRSAASRLRGTIGDLAGRYAPRRIDAVRVPARVR